MSHKGPLCDTPVPVPLSADVLELMDLVWGRPKLRERFAALASERAEFQEAGPEAVRRARQ